MKKLLLCSALLAVPHVAAADQLERFEEISNKMNAMMGEMMAKEIDAGGGDGDIVRVAIPTHAWNDEARAAANCILDRYEDEIGSGGIDNLMNRMEAALPNMETMMISEFTESEEMQSLLPQGITEDQSIEINQSCGMMDAQLERMQESGFSDAMMKAFSTTENAN